MKVWTVVGYFDGETDVTAHLTRKGALAEAIKTLWGIIGATSKTTHHDEFGETCFFGSHEDLMKRSSEELQDIYRAWQEPMYMLEGGLYMIEVIQATIQP